MVTECNSALSLVWAHIRAIGYSKTVGIKKDEPKGSSFFNIINTLIYFLTIFYILKINRQLIFTITDYLLLYMCIKI